jgi:hypothetical protein
MDQQAESYYGDRKNPKKGLENISEAQRKSLARCNVHMQIILPQLESGDI